MNTETTTTAPDEHEKELDFYKRVMDQATADTIWKAMSVLAIGIEATRGRTLDRAFENWPNTAEAVWDMLDGIMARAGLSDGKDRPFVSANEAEAAHLTAHDDAA